MAETRKAPAPASSVPEGARRLPVTSRRRILADRFARWLVVAGGMAIIASVLGILVFILIEVWPVLAGGKVLPAGAFPAAGKAVAVLSDEHRSHVATLGEDGRVRVLRAGSGEVVLDRPILEGQGGAGAGPRIARGLVPPGTSLLAGATDDGRVVLVPVAWRVSFEEQTRVVTPSIGEPLVFEVGAPGAAVRSFGAAFDPDRNVALVAAQTSDGELVVLRRGEERNEFTGETAAVSDAHRTRVVGAVTTLLVDHAQENLYGGTSDGRVLWWSLDDSGEPVNGWESRAGASAITAMSLLIGDRSVVVGEADGALSVWFQVRQGDVGWNLIRARDFPRRAGAVRLLAPSGRDKGFLAWDDSGGLGLFHSTSGRTIWTGDAGAGKALALTFAPKADGALLGSADRIASFEIRNPHPEVSFSTLFSKVWYEGHEKPEFVWQSTGGTDDFEPKLSLVPLLAGTLKGTFYSLFLAIPLGVLSAMYASQFMHERLRRWVKPSVEIMAALPSVVLGFIAGLWLAPRLEQVLPALALMVVVLPLSVLGTGFAWHALPGRIRDALPSGIEALVFSLTLGAAIAACLAMSRPIEALVFGGSAQTWLFDAMGLRYDQRNAIVVGLAMGFAVVPIIFAIAEDAFSNVPRNLTSGSLALGATRWQTVTRVVLPIASPGIFAAVIVGFGRAVGETMIVLMATGNTPILDWSPFNGFRTLSANIAVEIPEAPQGSSLYRTLFLAALLLFVLTFVANTAAELIRQRLRKRYSSL